MGKRVLACFAFAIAVAAGPSARAQATDTLDTVEIAAEPNSGGTAAATANGSASMTHDASDNVLELRDGSHLRGVVVEMRPGEYVVIITPGGRRTIGWRGIVRADGPAFPRGYTAPSIERSPSVPIAPPTDYLVPRADRIPLVVESAGPPLEISERFAAGGGRRFRPVAPPICTTPCTLYIDTPTFPLQGRARGFRTTSANVSLPPTGLRVRLRTASNARFYSGLGIAGGGGAIAATGAVMMFFGAIFNALSYPYRSGVGLVVGGGIVTGVGIATVIAGVVLVGTSRTGVESSSPLPSRGAITQPSVTIGPLSQGGFITGFSARF